MRRMVSGVIVTIAVVALGSGDPAALGTPGDPAPVPGAAPPAVTAGVAPACIGNGTAGNRVQLMYVRQESQASRYAEVVPQMREWAEQIDKMFLRGSTDTGGFRRVRWVTGADCLPTVVEHAIPDGITDFGQMLVALSDAGLRPADRKLLIAHDDPGYCGLGEIQPDDRPGPENLNNTQPYGLGGSMSTNCWGFPAAAHELLHILGAVQDSAPNSDELRHCTDYYELMCDGTQPGSPPEPVCPPSNRQQLDCNHDDYFDVTPAPGSYLATHWNVANSSFLDAAPWYLPPDRPEKPTISAASGSVTLGWEPPLFDGGSPVTGYSVTLQPSGDVIETGPATTLTVDGLPDGVPVSYAVRAVSDVGTGPGSIDSDVVTPTPEITSVTSLRGKAPTSVAAQPAGLMWVGTKAGLLKVTATGRTTLVSGRGSLSTPLRERTALRRTPMRPVSVAVHPTSGDVYVVDRLSDRVRRIHAGKVTSVTPRRLTPSSIGFDARGRLLVVEASQNRIWRQTRGQRFDRVAGSPTGRAGYAGDRGPALRALLRAPSGVAADEDGNLYVADRGNHRVRRISSAGRITTLAGNGADRVIPGMVFDGTDAIFLLLPRPTGIVYGAGRLFVQSAGRVVAIDPDSTGPPRSQVTYVGAPGELGNSGDGGPARLAAISDDVQLTLAGARLVVLDRSVDRIRRVAGPAG